MKDTETPIVEDGNAPKYTAIMAMHQAIHTKPAEFTNTVNNMLLTKAADAVEKRREEIAQGIFGNQNKEPDSDDVTAEPEVEAGAEETGESEPEAVETEVEEETPEE